MVDYKKPGHVAGTNPPQERKEETDSQDDPATENYAEHLARVMPDADSSKALLKARYKALHDAEHDDTD
jgi:hypothetical protein